MRRAGWGGERLSRCGFGVGEERVEGARGRAWLGERLYLEKVGAWDGSGSHAMEEKPWRGCQGGVGVGLWRGGLWAGC